MSVRIRFATDFVCPYCIAARETLLAAIGEREDVELEILPFELTPPGRERVDTYHDPVRREKYRNGLQPFCEKLGLAVRLPPKVIPRPYTRSAWEGYFFAKEWGLGERWCGLMYEAYFVRELDIGSIEVLTTLAEELGLDGTAFCAALEEHRYSKTVSAAVEETRALGVTAVPTIRIGSLRLAGELYTKEDFAFYLSAAEQGFDAPAPEGQLACGPDGC